jgi:hypothetical protein
MQPRNAPASAESLSTKPSAYETPARHSYRMPAARDVATGPEQQSQDDVGTRLRSEVRPQLTV